ncbi:MAG: hypothetical protein MUO54_07205, partial [Anaerolineales bacterium]|nr:hypothetical protein [Anaerolineales bacterium]
FTLKIRTPPSQVKEVKFFMDGDLVSTDIAEPFEYKFHTSNFIEGKHEMSAIGVLADGTQLDSNHITKVFLSSDQAWSETENNVGPLLIGTAVLSVLGIVVPLLVNRKKEYIPGKYGPAGGAVCPRCELPFSRSLFSPNMVTGKLVRCPHCGKFSIQPRASQARLQEALDRFNNKDLPGGIQPGENDLNKLIDDSRFED